jgi:alpha-amylase
MEDLVEARSQERGDFRNASFDFKVQPPRKKGGELRVLLSREGSLEEEPGRIPFGLSKALTFTPGLFHLKTDYELKNQGSRDAHFLFAVEWNLTLLAGDAPDRRYFVTGRDLSQPRLGGRGEENSVTEMGMEDDWLGLKIIFETPNPAKSWRYPVETISQSEGGFERVYQGSCLLFVWEVFLPAQGVFKTSVTTRFQEKS